MSWWSLLLKLLAGVESVDGDDSDTRAEIDPDG
jgi:hypothetical protein